MKCESLQVCPSQSLMHLPLVQMLPQKKKEKIIQILFVVADAIFLSLAVKTTLLPHLFLGTFELIFWSANVPLPISIPILIVHGRLSVCSLVVYSLFGIPIWMLRGFPTDTLVGWAVPTIRWVQPILFYSCHRQRHRVCLLSPCRIPRAPLYCTWKIVIRIGNVFKLTFISVYLFCPHQDGRAFTWQVKALAWQLSDKQEMILSEYQAAESSKHIPLPIK